MVIVSRYANFEEALKVFMKQSRERNRDISSAYVTAGQEAREKQREAVFRTKRKEERRGASGGRRR